ncbi:HER189Wp [Eremothecium sinecaudum]|uniref:HER189Wp n=1 Tax=Eremothecium sinecaudum TaxID=45286 RepID=A0A109V078_9SACH|nr:HER189Wp [Eremothecium sinecaudum]AMD21468.1 HER189Wp [Eremothecium sinecaudum]
MNRNPKPQQKPIQQTSPTPITQPTDTYVQPFLKELVPELSSLENLKDAERRIDVYLSRKRIDLHQSITQWTYQKPRDYNDTQYLRIFISTIAENQPWQTSSDDLELGNWTLRIEGRLVNNEAVDSARRPKFSTFLQSIAIDFHNKEATPVEKEEQNNEQVIDKIAESGVSQVQHSPIPSSKKYDIVEWHADPNSPVEFDGLDIKRNGTENVDCTITIQPKGYTGDQLQYSEALASVVGTSRGTVHEAIYSLYKYILLNDLLMPDENANYKSNQNDDKMVVKIDSMIVKLLTSSNVNEPKKYLRLMELPQLVNNHLSPIPPVKLNYTIQVDKASTYGELAFDIEVPSALVNQTDLNGLPPNPLAQQGMMLLTEFNTLSSQLEPQFASLDKRSQLLSLQLNSTANKYQFFNKLSQDPVPMLKDYMKSTVNALKVLSGDDGFDEDTVRRSKFYQENEAVLFENLGVLLSNGRM